MAGESDGVNVEVGKQLRDPHPFVQQAKKDLEKRKPGADGLLTTTIESPLNIEVAPANAGRALRIMDAILKGLLEVGFELSLSDDGQRRVLIEIEGQTFTARLRERTIKTPRVRKPGEHWTPRFDYSASGELKLLIRDAWGPVGDWEDTKRKKLEDRIDAVASGLLNKAQKTQAERKYWADHFKQQEEEAARRRDEELRVEELNAEVSRWHQSRRIKEYLAAVRATAIEHEGGIDPGSELDEWLMWATSYADSLDPLALSHDHEADSAQEEAEGDG